MELQVVADKLVEVTYAELQLEEEFLVAGSHPEGRGLAT